jgi:hypothetical protein
MRLTEQCLRMYDLSTHIHEVPRYIYRYIFLFSENLVTSRLYGMRGMKGYLFNQSNFINKESKPAILAAVSETTGRAFDSCFRGFP